MNNIGESSVFIPICRAGSAHSSLQEVTLRSPHLWRFGHAHLSYSNQIAQQTGPIYRRPHLQWRFAESRRPLLRCSPATQLLDHDQRNTLNVGFNGNLPYRIFGSFNVYYGSGFSNGDNACISLALHRRLSSVPHNGRPRTRQGILASAFGTLTFNALNIGSHCASCSTTASPSVVFITTTHASSMPSSATASSSKAHNFLRYTHASNPSP